MNMSSSKKENLTGLSLYSEKREGMGSDIVECWDRQAVSLLLKLTS